MKHALMWIGALAILGVLQATLRDLVGAYNYQIAVLVGVNIILAVSLNLINGFTGQFSIGHAGFYAVGAYASAALVKYAGPAIRGALSFLPAMAQDTVLLLAGILAAALVAGI